MYVRKEAAETNNRNIKSSVCCTAVRLGSTRRKGRAPEKSGLSFIRNREVFFVIYNLQNKQIMDTE